MQEKILILWKNIKELMNNEDSRPHIFVGTKNSTFKLQDIICVQKSFTCMQWMKNVELIEKMISEVKYRIRSICHAVHYKKSTRLMPQFLVDGAVKLLNYF